METNRLEMKNVTYQYGKGSKSNVILENQSYSFSSGTMYAIQGKSGVGKSTTLAVFGALDYPKSGEILYNGENIEKIGYDKYRSNIVSIIFQDYNLLPYLNGYQNIELAIRLAKGTKASAGQIGEYLKAVGISDEIARRNVRKLSGGEQQRIAIARAWAMNSKIILADEPTGNLDMDTAEEVIDILYEMASKQGKCVIAVTHTPNLAQRADVTLTIRDKHFEK